MTLADDLKPLLTDIRSIPGKLGLRPYSVCAVDICYDEEFKYPSKDAVEILESDGQSPKVRWLNDEQKALGGYDDGTIEVGPITPGDGTIGTLLGAIYRSPSAGNVARFVVTGPQYPNGANYALKSIRTDRALHYTMILERSP